MQSPGIEVSEEKIPAKGLGIGCSLVDHDPGGGDLDYSYAQDAPSDMPELAVGLRVRHPIFGTGTVQEISGSGPGTKLRIRFERAGLKTVMLKYANLELG